MKDNTRIYCISNHLEKKTLNTWLWRNIGLLNDGLGLWLILFCKLCVGDTEVDLIYPWVVEQSWDVGSLFYLPRKTNLGWHLFKSMHGYDMTHLEIFSWYLESLVDFPQRYLWPICLTKNLVFLSFSSPNLSREEKHLSIHTKYSHSMILIFYIFLVINQNLFINP